MYTFSMKRKRQTTERPNVNLRPKTYALLVDLADKHRRSLVETAALAVESAAVADGISQAAEETLTAPSGS